VPTRRLPFEACFNFRDLGGYRAGNRTVRWGALYRSGRMDLLTRGDLERAADLGVRTVVDLRMSMELARDGRAPLPGEIAVHHVPMFELDALPFERFAPDEPERAPGADYYAMAVHGAAAVATAFELLATGPHPAVFHCTAGKDRTGILAALLLSSLGVDDAAIAADYHLSDEGMADLLAWVEDGNGDAALREGLAEVPPWAHWSPPEAMVAFLGQVRAAHGSIDGYLADVGVGADIRDALRARMLIDA
jgi:protein-tyrosine phosphatase